MIYERQYDRLMKGLCWHGVVAVCAACVLVVSLAFEGSVWAVLNMEIGKEKDFGAIFTILIEVTGILRCYWLRGARLMRTSSRKWTPSRLINL